MLIVYRSLKNNVIVCDKDSEDKFLSFKKTSRSKLLEAGWLRWEYDMPIGFSKYLEISSPVELSIIPLTEKELKKSIKKSTKYVLACPVDISKSFSKAIKLFKGPGIRFLNMILLSCDTVWSVHKDDTTSRGRIKFFSKKNRAITAAEGTSLYLMSVRVDNENKILGDFKLIEK